MAKTELARAFVRREAGKCYNAHTDGITYVLHASPIAVWHGNQVQFFWHGYYTRTTAAHMNEILRALGANSRASYAQARDTNQQVFIWGQA